MRSQDHLYIRLSPSELWSFYGDIEGVFRGGGRPNSPVLVTTNGLRPRDFVVVNEDDGKEYVLPRKDKGLSFASSIKRLEGLEDGPKIRGWVYRLPKGTKLPDGLAVSYRLGKENHPLIVVSKKMLKSEAEKLLVKLGSMLVKTNTEIQ